MFTKNSLHVHQYRHMVQVITRGMMDASAILVDVTDARGDSLSCSIWQPFELSAALPPHGKAGA
jgi:hypothetical protein